MNGGIHGVGHLNKLAETLGLPPDKLHTTVQLMRHEGLSFAEAANLAGMDLSGIDPVEFTITLQSVPESMQGQFLQDADQLPAVLRETVEQSFTPPQETAARTPASTSDPAASATPSSSAPNSSSGTAANSGTSTVVTNPAGNVPPGQQPVSTRADASAIASSVLGMVTGNGQTRAADAPSLTQFVQRLFGAESARGEGARADSAQNLNLPQARTAQGADAIQNPNGVIQARADGNSNSPLQALASLVQGRADGNPGSQTPAAAATLNTFAAQQQGTQQASAFAGQQSAAQAQVADRANADSPLPLNLRGGEGAVASFRSSDGATLHNLPLDRALATQQQMQAQQMPSAAPQARPDAAAAQVMAQLAGATVLIHPQAHTMANQIGQNVVPMPSGAENAALSARDSLLAPAGHTLAGFLRRDHRGRPDTMGRRGQEWLLAMLPGNRKRRAEGGPEVMSVQWLFWVLTVVAYGALAMAVVVMIPSGGRLLDVNGNVSFGVYALLAGGIAAIASWLIGRKLSK